MNELLMMAETMGVTVEWEDFLPLGWAGVYWAAATTVYLLRGMTHVRTRTVFAHELGHAHYGHEGRSTADEWLADVWAAEQLIPRELYAEAARDNPSLDVLARRLGVTEHMARVRIRSARGLQHFTDHQPYRIGLGVPAAGMSAERRVEPRRLTAAMPVVQAAPRVTVQPIPRERVLVPA